MKCSEKKIGTKRNGKTQPDIPMQILLLGYTLVTSRIDQLVRLVNDISNIVDASSQA